MCVYVYVCECTLVHIGVSAYFMLVLNGFESSLTHEPVTGRASDRGVDLYGMAMRNKCWFIIYNNLSP